MDVAQLASTSDRIAATRARLEKVALLVELLRGLTADEVPVAVAWLSGHLRQGRIGLGWSALAAAAGPVAPADPGLFDALAAPGDTAPLALLDADRRFEHIARVKGAGSSAARGAALAALLARTDERGRDFLTRLVLGELRQGALAGIMEDAVARAADVPLAALRRAAMLSGDLEQAAVAALTLGAAGLARFAPQVFHPVRPMLAQPADDLDAALARLGEAELEYKLDGARIQAHRAGDQVRVYSRTLHDVTASVPEIVDAVRALPLREAILDGEAIALATDGSPRPFQVTMRRFGRRLDVAALRAELPLTAFFFDLLWLDGESLIDAPLRERVARLRAIAPASAIPWLVTAEPARAAAFLDESLDRGHEGLMAKALESRYEAGGRGNAWLKVKASHTLDLVVLAAEWGNGRRTGKLSNLHLGARDPATGGFVMLGKTFKGMTDEMLEWQTREFPKHAVRTDRHVVHLAPEIVVEVAFDDVQESPRYQGGMALRLARVKAYRPDKTPAEADTVETVRAILARGRKPGHEPDH